MTVTKKGSGPPPKPPETAPFRPQRLARVVFAGMVSTGLTHPLDVLKVRLQISPSRCSSYQLASQIYKYEGWKAFYNGLTAGLLRQATYTTARLATYDVLYDMYAGKYKEKPIPRDKVAIAIVAGLVGGLVGNPSEVALVRQMAGGTPSLATPQRCCHSYYYVKKYKGTIDALKRIQRKEGFAGWWRGVSLTLLRSVFISVGQVGVYLKIREQLKKNNTFKDRLSLSLVSSLMTSFIIALTTLPIDMMKSIYQSSSEAGSLKMILNRIILCKGIKHLWKGFTPYFARLAIHTVATFMILEEMKRAAEKRKEAEDKDGKNKERND